MVMTLRRLLIGGASGAWVGGAVRFWRSGGQCRERVARREPCGYVDVDGHLSEFVCGAGSTAAPF